MSSLGSLNTMLSKFFGSATPTSLIITGAPGTGKTTLALEIMNTFKDKFKNVYISTRVGDKSLYQEFPWLKTLEEQTKLIDAGKMFLQSLWTEKSEKKPAVQETARRFVETIYGEIPKKASRMMYDKYFRDMDIPELDTLYNEVDTNLPDRTLLVIDSIEGLATKYEIDQEQLVMTLIKDLVEGGNTDIIFILEKSRDNLEYLTDGVIVLDQSTIETKRVRTLVIEKLRGIGTYINRYLFTLKDGRFYVFSHEKSLSLRNYKFKQVNDVSADIKSSGCADFDNLLGGGIRKGSFNLIELDESVTKDEYRAFLIPIFVAQYLRGGGEIAILPLGSAIEETRQLLSKYTSEHVFDRQTKIIDYSSVSSEFKYVVPVGFGGREQYIKTLQQAITEMRELGETLFYYIGFDAIEKYRGPIAITEIANIIDTLIDSGDIAIGILKPGVEDKALIAHMTNTHFKLLHVNNILCIYGISPKTILYAIEQDEDQYYRLVPIV